MNFIPTTATAAEKLKHLAKKQRKATGSSLAVALDAVAQANGYANWKHVTVCVDQAPAVARIAPLPQGLADLLADDVKRYPPLSASELAFREGLVFAMDAKDADGMPLGADVIECEDLWLLAAGDMWRILVHARDDETDRSLAESLDAEELIQTVREDLGNYRFFRYTGTAIPTTLDEAFSQVLGRYFFPPVYVWLAGKFIDMAAVPEVRVDGKVIYASSTSGPARAVRTFRSPGSTPEPVAAPILFDQPPRDGLIFRLDISRSKPGLYESRLSYGDQEIDEATGYTSIRAALEDAAGVTGDVAGLEVAYRGLVVGTYTLEAVRSEAEQIAKRAVATHAAFADF
jgi:hypothetical protein